MSSRRLINPLLILGSLLLWTQVVVADSPPDFDLDILPILTKSGCNSGACHGAAVGRGEFRLSLFGSRPESDFLTITQHLESRRVNTAFPERSLLLLKPTGGVDHEGGTRLDDSSPDAAVIRSWIAAGALRSGLARIVEIQAEPAQLIVPIGASAELTFKARLQDGTYRNITGQVTLIVQDPDSVAVSGICKITPRRAGRHVLVARYPGHVVPVEVLTPFSSDKDASATSLQSTLIAGPTAGSRTVSETTSLIDRRIDERLHLMNLRPVALADDAEFLCRATLELTGRRPSVERIRSFLSDAAADKRTGLVDSLIDSPEFTDYWTWLFARMLRVQDSRSQESAAQWHAWLRARIAEDAPLNEAAAAMVIAGGIPEEFGPAAFHTVAADARLEAEYFSESLLGVRLRCANCHDHPLDRWTQDDYHGLAAIFATVDRVDSIRSKPNGTTIHPGTGEPAVPRILLTGIVTAEGGQEQLARWISDPDNAMFSRHMVNQVWKHLFGRGLIEPADDIRVTNPATDPELLVELSEGFAESGFRLRPLIRSISRTRAWCRTSHEDASHSETSSGAEAIFLSRRTRRPLSPEVLLDCIGDVTGVREFTGSSKQSNRLIHTSKHLERVVALEALGRCTMKGTCAGTTESTDSLPLALHLINGDLLNRRLTPQSPLLVALLNLQGDDETLVNELYLRTVSRPPTENERHVWTSELEASRLSGKFTDTVVDMCWALLTSDEFLTSP